MIVNIIPIHDKKVNDYLSLNILKFTWAFVVNFQSINLYWYSTKSYDVPISFQITLSCKVLTYIIESVMKLYRKNYIAFVVDVANVN